MVKKFITVFLIKCPISWVVVIMICLSVRQVVGEPFLDESCSLYSRLHPNYLKSRNGLPCIFTLAQTCLFLGQLFSHLGDPTKILPCMRTLESPYHLVAVSGAHFTQGTILIVILVSSGSAKSRTYQFAVGGFLVSRRGWPGRLRACRIWTFINSV